jgi:two-component system, NarL family, sensor histidine kinase UhpB
MCRPVARITGAAPSIRATAVPRSKETAIPADADRLPKPAPPWRSRISDFVWFGRTLRTQIVIVFMALSSVAASVAGGVIIYKASVSTRIEIAASMRLAGLMVNEAVQLIQQGMPAEPFLRKLPGQMRLVRHVRVEVRDAAGQPLEMTASPPGAGGPAAAAGHPRFQEGRSGVARDDGRVAAPAWFAMLIGPPVERREVEVAVDGRRLGTVEIISEPRDEIAEVWGNTVALGTVAATMVLAIVAILYLVLGRVLDPLRALGAGLHGLERRDYKVRLARPKVLEFAAIVDRFNALAGALDAIRTEKLALNRRVITAQDDERRRTALELHDEVGPSLFGLKANVASIARAVQSISPAPAAVTVAERVQDLTAIVDHLQGINRGMLNRLRPMALGNLPLADIIAGMVRDRAREHPHIVFTHDVGALDRSYDDTVDLTVYRCVQESLTNAIRHADAKAIDVRVAVYGGEVLQDAGPGLAAAANSCLRAAPDTAPAPQAAAGESLELTVRDDGVGMEAGRAPGFGLRGMQERVQALGGEFATETGSGHTGGTCVRIVIPLPPRPAGSPQTGDYASTST